MYNYYNYIWIALFIFYRQLQHPIQTDELLLPSLFVQRMNKFIRLMMQYGCLYEKIKSQLLVNDKL